MPRVRSGSTFSAGGTAGSREWGALQLQGAVGVSCRQFGRGGCPSPNKSDMGFQAFRGRHAPSVEERLSRAIHAAGARRGEPVMIGPAPDFVAAAGSTLTHAELTGALELLRIFGNSYRGCSGVAPILEETPRPLDAS
jgi:hypothetical protein